MIVNDGFQLASDNIFIFCPNLLGDYKVTLFLLGFNGSPFWLLKMVSKKLNDSIKIIKLIKKQRYTQILS